MAHVPNGDSSLQLYSTTTTCTTYELLLKHQMHMSSGRTYLHLQRLCILTLSQTRLAARNALHEPLTLLLSLQGGLGPMQGQANHFVRYAPEKIEYGVKRYTNETRRLYGVMEKHLSDGREWLAAGQYTIADMANFSWVFMHEWAGKCCTGLHACWQYCSEDQDHKGKMSMPECLLANVALHDKAAAADALGSLGSFGQAQEP